MAKLLLKEYVDKYYPKYKELYDAYLADTRNEAISVELDNYTTKYFHNTEIFFCESEREIEEGMPTTGNWIMQAYYTKRIYFFRFVKLDKFDILVNPDLVLIEEPEA